MQVQTQQAREVSSPAPSKNKLCWLGAVGFVLMVTATGTALGVTLLSPTGDLRGTSTESPTTSPVTASPSTSPTTPQPSQSPTTSQPTSSPSFGPTTLSPTLSPTTVPTTNESVVFFLYAEGSFTNKVLSIRNTGGRTISLADVGIEYRINGGSGATTQVSLPEADLAVDDTYTICNRDPTNMLPSFGVSCDLFTFDVLHNGDDVVVLRLGGIIVDIIGNTGSGDPGSGWRVCGGAFTNDHFLKRVASVRSGNLDGLVDSWNGQDSNGSCEWISGTYN